MNRNLWRALLAIAALLIAVATALGAVASHALDSVLDASSLHSFETAVDYQFWHGLGLLALAIYGERQAGSKLLTLAVALITVGIVLFCGGLYASSLGGPRWIASLAPVGGSALIAGWLGAAIALFRPTQATPPQND